MEYKKKEKKQKMRNKKMGIEESADLITGVLPDWLARLFVNNSPAMLLNGWLSVCDPTTLSDLFVIRK